MSPQDDPAKGKWSRFADFDVYAGNRIKTGRIGQVIIRAMLKCSRARIDQNALRLNVADRPLAVLEISLEWVDSITVSTAPLPPSIHRIALNTAIGTQVLK